MKLKAKKYPDSKWIIEELDQWLKESHNINIGKIRNMSKKLNIPFGLFFLNEPLAQDEVIAEFRSDPSPELEETISYMREIQAWMSDNNEQQYGANFNYKLIDRKLSSEQAAEKIREFLDLLPDWSKNCQDADEAFKLVRKICEDNNILVQLGSTTEGQNVRALDVDEFKAFILTDKYAPLIFINNNDTKYEKLFSLIYAIVHLFLGENSLFDENEFFINQDTDFFYSEVATELIAPKTTVYEKWIELEKVDLTEKVKKLAKIFTCSNSIILLRLKNLNLIDQDDYLKQLNIFKQEGMKSQKESTSQAHLDTDKDLKFDSNFIRALNQSVIERTTSLTDALDLTRTDLNTFYKLVKTKASSS